MAVTRDRGNINCLRIIGRNGEEVKKIKDIIEAKKSKLFRAGKRLRIRMSFNYVEASQSRNTTVRQGLDKRLDPPRRARRL